MPNPIVRRRLPTSFPWRPEKLFSGGRRGFYLDSRHGLYQSSDRAVPSASDGDVVGGWDSIVNGYQAIQTVSTSIKPILKTNRLNGVRAVRLDGIDDSIVIQNFSISTYISVLCVIAITSTTPGNCLFFEHGPNSNTTDGFYLEGRGAEVWNIRRAAIRHYASGLDEWTGTDSSLIEFHYNGTGSVYKNGAVLGGVEVHGTALDDTLLTSNFYIGTRSTGSYVFSSVDFVQLIVREGVLSDTELLKYRSYVRKDFGLTIS